MGFATGFTGGVTVTLSIACLSVLAHQRNRLAQAEALRSQAYLLDTLSTPQGPPGARILGPPPPSRAERAAAARASLAGRAKDRWNHEVSNAARWAQGATGPAAAAEQVEDAVGRAWSRALGGGVDQAEAVLPAGGAGEGARGTAEAGADAARVTVASIVGKARTAVGVAQEKIEAAVVAVGSVSAPAAPPPGVSPVERALQQRYESRHEVFSKSAAEIINERYRPIDERDNTTLRGL
ncbi:hypothetical protein RB595_008457 [Gaeumannomyces hyphopodioides]